MHKNLKLILIVVAIVAGLVAIDTLQALIFDNSPLLKIRSDYNGGSIARIDKGLLVNHYYCTNKDEKTIFKGKKHSCPENDAVKIEVVDIIDTTKELKEFACDEIPEEFYRDDNYIYYYNCIKSKYVLVKYTNEYEETVKDALMRGIISISDLDKFKISYIKQEIRNGNEDNEKKCLNSQLGGYISTETDEIEELKISSLIDIDLTKIDYSFIGKSENGIYAILKTDDEKIIKELDNYFYKNYSGYRSTIYNDYKIYAYNKRNDVELNDYISECGQ